MHKLIAFISFAIAFVLFAPIAAVSQTAQHGIAVTWTQTTDAGVQLNTVYRSATPGGPYTAVFTSTAPVTSYFDPLTPALQGTQACYVVTATDIIESAKSTEACATFPAPPPAPTSPKAVKQ